MQTPICEVCLNSKMLCNYCQDKLDKKDITDLEVEVSRYLYGLSKKIATLRDIEIKKVMDCGVLLIVTDRGKAARLVGRNGSVVKKIAKQFKKAIRIVEEAPDFRRFLEGLTSPVSISGINTLYRDDKEIYKIRIPSLKKNHLMIDPETLSSILSHFYHINAELVFE
jgi:transcription antitermination factor NusA-like protein